MLDAAGSGETALGAVGFPHASVFERPVVWWGLAPGRGLWGVSCEGAQEQHSRC